MQDTVLSRTSNSTLSQHRGHLRAGNIKLPVDGGDVRQEQCVWNRLLPKLVKQHASRLLWSSERLLKRAAHELRTEASTLHIDRLAGTVSMPASSLSRFVVWVLFENDDALHDGGHREILFSCQLSAVHATE